MQFILILNLQNSFNGYVHCLASKIYRAIGFCQSHLYRSFETWSCKSMWRRCYDEVFTPAEH